ncbi:MAG: hypothetical protein ABI036_18125 [Fibrobacteria bacterium]
MFKIRALATLATLVSTAAAHSTVIPEKTPKTSVSSAEPKTSAGAQPEHHHHHNSEAANTVKVVDGIRAEFDMMEISAHKAMADEMGIKWTPDPTKNFHVSVTLANEKDGEALRDIPVHLSVTDPDGHLTEKSAEVMSAPGMYHYGIDFQRSAPGVYHAVASFELAGQPHKVQAELHLH